MRSAHNDTRLSFGEFGLFHSFLCSLLSVLSCVFLLRIQVLQQLLMDVNALVVVVVWVSGTGRQVGGEGIRQACVQTAGSGLFARCVDYCWRASLEATHYFASYILHLYSYTSNELFYAPAVSPLSEVSKMIFTAVVQQYSSSSTTSVVYGEHTQRTRTRTPSRSLHYCFRGPRLSFRLHAPLVCFLLSRGAACRCSSHLADKLLLYNSAVCTLLWRKDSQQFKQQPAVYEYGTVYIHTYQPGMYTHIIFVFLFVVMFFDDAPRSRHVSQS